MVKSLNIGQSASEPLNERKLHRLVSPFIRHKAQVSLKYWALEIVKIQSGLIGNYKRYYGNDNIATQMNAKELALGKINATSDTLGMYCYAVAMGVNIEHFTRFMTHPTITALVNNAKSNLIQPEKRKNSFDTSIKEIKQGYLEPWKYNNLLQERLPKIISSINEQMNSNLKLKDFLYNIVNKEQFDYIRREILNNPKFKLTVSNVQMQEDDDYIDENGYSRNLRNDFARWLQDSINFSEKLGFKDINGKMASLFEKIKNESEALKVFGQLLGINQSIKSDSYDFYKYLNVLPDYIEKVKSRLKDEIENNSILKDSEKRAYQDSIKYLFGGRMDFNRFILNEDYRNKCIEDYKSLTKNSQINILECLAGSKHFMEMISLACSSDQTLLPIASVKYKTLKSMISDSVNGKFFSQEGENSKSVSENIYRKLSSYIDDLIIQDFFDSNQMTVYPEANDTYSIISDKKTINVKSKGQPFDLTTMQGRSEFTSWFENKMMFDIKNIDSLKNNKFVQMLTIDAKEDTNLGKTYYFLKPSLNYDPNHNDLYKNIVADMVKGLQDLNNVKINQHKVSDLFFLYDLIVNRGKKNSNSFAYFNSQATNINDKSTLASAYNNHIVSMDRDGIKLDYNRFDFINRGIAEVKRTDKQTHIFQVKQQYNQEKKKNDNTYYVREDDGKDYKVEQDENAIIKNIPVKTTITRSVDMKSITSMFNDLNDGLIIIKC